MEIIPMVVDKNDDMGNFCSSDGAQLFINREPIARTLTCVCGGGLSIHHNNMVVTKMEKTDECRMLGMMGEEGFEKVRRVYATDALVPAISTKEDRIKILEEPSIEIKQATKEGSIKCKVGGCYDASYPDSTTRRGRVQEGGDVTPTLTASNSENIHYVETQYRIRKLTPKECWRLMGYTDEDYEKAASVNSNTQLYKQAGNAIVKQVLMAIFRQMIPENARAK